MGRWTSRKIGTAAVILILGVIAVGYLGLRVWAHYWLLSRIESATKFATQYGNPVVTAIDRYREDNGEYPADMRDQLIPGYVDEIHPAWYLQTDGRPVLSTRLFPFEDWFLTWDFEERRWRLDTIELNVEQPH